MEVNRTPDRASHSRSAQRTAVIKQVPALSRQGKEEGETEAQRPPPPRRLTAAASPPREPTVCSGQPAARVRLFSLLVLLFPLPRSPPDLSHDRGGSGRNGQGKKSWAEPTRPHSPPPPLPATQILAGAARRTQESGAGSQASPTARSWVGELAKQGKQPPSPPLANPFPRYAPGAAGGGDSFI